MTRDRKEVFGGNVRQEAPYWREVFSLSIMQAVKIKEVDKFSVLPNVSAGLLRRGEKKKERFRLEGWPCTNSGGPRVIPLTQALQNYN